ncbi:hypothetical protein BV898_17086 [Hypsibius exemplaris]|uniref:Uncharacterized protein n=1 Tax=Hypsibius exemplaris TaxID=2072580 RepID=A0A9X6RLT2_HYPEX|nr:hypothetical protein BV898_17086 [Hypsibius exemplaris]
MTCEVPITLITTYVPALPIYDDSRNRFKKPQRKLTPQMKLLCDRYICVPEFRVTVTNFEVTKSVVKGHPDNQSDYRSNGRANGRTEASRTNGRADGMANEQTDRRTDWRINAQTD